MSIEELRAYCEESERQLGPDGSIVVTVPPRDRYARSYRVCRGLSGQVIGGDRSGRLLIAIPCRKVRAFLRKFDTQTELDAAETRQA